MQLLGGKVYRCLKVMKIIVRQPGKMKRHLACYQQRMADGRLRERNVLPSEKMSDDEVNQHDYKTAHGTQLEILCWWDGIGLDWIGWTEVGWDEIPSWLLSIAADASPPSACTVAALL